MESERESSSSLSSVIPPRLVAQRARASKERAKSYPYRASLDDLRRSRGKNDPVRKIEKQQMPRQGKRQGGATPSGAKTNESPTGRTAVGPQAFNLGKLRAKLLPKVGRAHNSSLNTISEAGRSVNALDRLQVHTQRMNQLQSSYVKGRERELNQKHNAGKKRFTPDTPDKVRYLHSKFRQVFQPFGKNREKYADRNQTKTQSVHGHKDSQQPKSL